MDARIDSTVEPVSTVISSDNRIVCQDEQTDNRIYSSCGITATVHCPDKFSSVGIGITFSRIDNGELLLWNQEEVDTKLRDLIHAPV